MSGYLDTSMAVRYLVRDVPEMAEQAATVIDGEEILWITGVALVEGRLRDEIGLSAAEGNGYRPTYGVTPQAEH